MTSIRAAKSKGSQFEYDCQASLEQFYKEVVRTSERGYQRQYDLRIEIGNRTKDYLAVECKRHAKFSWNQLRKLHQKLAHVANDAQNHYVLFRPNQQPCLIFYCDDDQKYRIVEFETYFSVPFIKHKSTRVKK